MDGHAMKRQPIRAMAPIETARLLLSSGDTTRCSAPIP